MHASLYERADDGGLGYNTAICVAPDGALLVFRAHLATLPVDDVAPAVALLTGASPDVAVILVAELAGLGARGHAVLAAVAARDTTDRDVRRVAHDRSSYADVWALAEALLQHDELAAAWRARHVVMVERMIGTKTGTGGSTGASYLRSRLDLRYFPLLWDLRSVL